MGDSEDRLGRGSQPLSSWQPAHVEVRGQLAHGDSYFLSFFGLSLSVSLPGKWHTHTAYQKQQITEPQWQKAGLVTQSPWSSLTSLPLDKHAWAWVCFVLGRSEISGSHSSLLPPVFVTHGHSPVS